MTTDRATTFVSLARYAVQRQSSMASESMQAQAS